MPHASITDKTRRAVILAALSGESPTEVARRHGVTRQYVYRQTRKAKREVREELEFWLHVKRIIESKP